MSINVDGEKRAYAVLIEAGLTPEGAAGLIGNMEAESDGFWPWKVEYLCINRLREHGIKDRNGNYYTQDSYTAALDSGEISAEEFLHPLPGKQYGYGYVQWTSPGRKAGLWNLAHEKGVSMADENMQLEYLLYELKTSYTGVLKVLKSATSIRQASDYVLKHFEQPADTSEAVCAGRAARGQLFYDKYVKTTATAPTKAGGRTADKYISAFKSWEGYSEANGKYREIIDLYNSIKPLPRGYAVQYKDEWCDTTVSAAGIKAGMSELIGRECGCEEHVNIFKKLGIWIEDGTITPEPGYPIVYSWRVSKQPNDAYSDHIGAVVSVQNGTITVIEGNKGEAVGYRTIPVGWGNIRGYAAPKYDAAAAAGSTTETGGSTSAGGSTSGSGSAETYLTRGMTGSAVKKMQTMLIAVGYSCGGCGADGDFGNDTYAALCKFQAAKGLSVDGIYGPVSKKTLKKAYKAKKNANSSTEVSSSGGLNEKPQWVGRCTGNGVNVRVYAGTIYPNIKSWPKLNKGNLVDVCDSVPDECGAKWYFVRIDGHIFGFVHSNYIARA